MSDNEIIQKLQDELKSNKDYIEKLETCRVCLRVKNCEVCKFNTVEDLWCFGDRFEVDEVKFKTYRSSRS